MITMIDFNGNVQSLVGLSTDSKPTDVGNGSTFFEMNTSKVFMFNEAASSWVEVQ